MNPERIKAVGNRLRRYRQLFYENQTELSNKLGCSRALLNLYELGQRPLNLEIAIKLAEMENMSLDAIYRGIRRVPRDKLLLPPEDEQP